jgi:hypothetical protein
MIWSANVKPDNLFFILFKIIFFLFFLYIEIRFKHTIAAK